MPEEVFNPVAEALALDGLELKREPESGALIVEATGGATPFRSSTGNIGAPVFVSPSLLAARESARDRQLHPAQAIYRSLVRDALLPAASGIARTPGVIITAGASTAADLTLAIQESDTLLDDPAINQFPQIVKQLEQGEITQEQFDEAAEANRAARRTARDRRERVHQTVMRDIAKFAYPFESSANWVDKLRESNSLAIDPRAIIEGEGVASVKEAVSTPAWWTNRFPGLAGAALANLLPGLVAAKSARIAGVATAKARELGFAVSSATLFAQETGLSFDQMRDDLVALGVPAEDAAVYASRGAVPYGIVASLVERGVLPYQFGKGRFNTSQQGVRAVFLRALAGGVGEITEEEVQLLLETTTRYMVGEAVGESLENDVIPTVRDVFESGIGAFGGGTVAGAFNRGSARRREVDESEVRAITEQVIQPPSPERVEVSDQFAAASEEDRGEILEVAEDIIADPETTAEEKEAVENLVDDMLQAGAAEDTGIQTTPLTIGETDATDAQPAAQPPQEPQEEAEVAPTDAQPTEAAAEEPAAEPTEPTPFDREAALAAAAAVEGTDVDPQQVVDLVPIYVEKGSRAGNRALNELAEANFANAAEIQKFKERVAEDVIGRFVAAPSRGSTGIKGAIMRAIRGEQPQPTVTQKAALQGSLRRQSRTAAQAFREGVKSLRGEIKSIREELRERQRKQIKNIDDLRRQLERAIKQQIPLRPGEPGFGKPPPPSSKKKERTKTKVHPRAQGRFLGAVRTVRTPEQLEKALDRVERIASIETFRDAVSRFKKRERLKDAKLTQARRDQIRTLVEAARAAAFSEGNKTRKFATPEEYDIVTDILNGVSNQIKAIENEHRLENRQIADEFVERKKELLDEIVRNVLSSRLPIRGRGRIIEDTEVGIIKRAFRQMLDIDNITRAVEGLWDGDGPLNQLMHVEMKEAEERMFVGLKVEREQLGDWAADSGFDARGTSPAQRRKTALTDMVAKMVGSQGDASLQRIRVTIAGQEMDITLDEAAHFLALDKTSLARIKRGAPIVFFGAKQTGIYHVTLDEVRAIQRQVREAGLSPMIRAMKANLSGPLRQQLFDILRRLRGWEPEQEDGYYPLSIDLGASPKIGLPEVVQKGEDAIFDSYVGRVGFNENTGVSNNRVDNLNPILIKGAVATYLDHVDHVMRIVHLSEQIRNVASIVLDRRFEIAVNGRYGTAMNDALKKHMIVGSYVDVDHATKADRRLQYLNTLVGTTYLATNEQTWIRQLGGLFTLWAHVGNSVFRDGILSLGQSNDEIQRIMSDSGYLDDRYQGSSMGRFSNMGAGGFSSLDTAGFTYSLKALVRSVRNPKGSHLAYRSMLDSIKVLDWFDRIVAVVAAGGYDSQAKKNNPEWSEQERREWVILRMNDAMRSTQNSSSRNDGTTFAVTTRNSLVRAFLLFTSDPLKSYNMLFRAAQQGPKQGATVAAAILMKNLWSGVVTGGGAAFYWWLGSLFGDVEDEDKLRMMIDARERAVWRTSRDLAGTIYFGDAVVEAVEAIHRGFNSNNIGDAPVFEAIRAHFQAFGDVVQAVEAGSEADMDEAVRQSKQAFRKMWEDASPIYGNPALIPYYRVKRIQAGFRGEVPGSRQKKRKKGRRSGVRRGT